MVHLWRSGRISISSIGPEGRSAVLGLGEALVVSVQAQVLHRHQLPWEKMLSKKIGQCTKESVFFQNMANTWLVQKKHRCDRSTIKAERAAAPAGIWKHTIEPGAVQGLECSSRMVCRQTLDVDAPLWTRQTLLVRRSGSNNSSALTVIRKHWNWPSDGYCCTLFFLI